MEIRDPIHGMITISPQEGKILDSPAFQRLRRIKQLGFSELSFPGAVHNRYIHSVGACHLAGVAFDAIFSKNDLKFNLSLGQKKTLRQTLKLAALLHDVGHGPLSHSSEKAMCFLKELNVGSYPEELRNHPNQQASHEDYGIKLITESSLTRVIDEVDPVAVASLVSVDVDPPSGYFVVDGLNLTPIFRQLVSSELDVDRLDYLERDAFFCGSHYGKIEASWLLANLSVHQYEEQVHLALNRSALYAFEDFLLSRHHMNLMVYNHHKSIIYEEFLFRYFDEKNISFKFPTNIEDYINCTDDALHSALKKDESFSAWAFRIVNQKSYKRLLEHHSALGSKAHLKEILQFLEGNSSLDVIYSKTSASLSRYYEIEKKESTKNKNSDKTLFVIDSYNIASEPTPIEKVTVLFKNYANTKHIERIFVAPESLELAQKLVNDFVRNSESIRKPSESFS